LFLLLRCNKELGGFLRKNGGIKLKNNQETKSLIIIFGQEGVGKTTIISTLPEYIPNSAGVDGEDLLNVNPWAWNEKTKKLLWENVIDTTRNFWEFGYNPVVTGSFFNYYSEFQEFKGQIPEAKNIIVIQLCADKEIRDDRRRKRPKKYQKEVSDWVDNYYPEDQEFCKHSNELPYLRIASDKQKVEETITTILEHLDRRGLDY